MTTTRRSAAAFRARFERERATAPGIEPSEPSDSVVASIPRGMRLAGAWSWRLLLVAMVIVGVLYLVVKLSLIVIPVLIAVLVSALLVPFSSFLQRIRVPRWLAILIAFLVALFVVGWLLYLIPQRVQAEAHELQVQTLHSLKELEAWLTGPPFDLTHAQINGYIGDAVTAIRADSRALINSALSIGSTIGHVATGFLITAFTTLFFLIDGKGIWAWIVRIFPKRARAGIDGAGQAGWHTLVSFARVQVLVAAIDAAGIGLGALSLGIPLVIPVAVVVFLGSFIPVVGAVFTGVIAVLVALVFKGIWFALIMLAVVLFVQQLESHVLQPLIMGSAVKVHPLAVVLVVTTGSLLAGIPGALFAVPLAAVVNVMVHYLASGAWKPEADVGPPTAGLWRMVPRDRLRIGR